MYTQACCHIPVYQAEGSGVEGYHELYDKLDASPGYMRLSQTTAPTNKTMKILAGASDSQQNK